MLVRIYADVTEISFSLKGLQLQWERMEEYLWVIIYCTGCCWSLFLG